MCTKSSGAPETGGERNRQQHPTLVLALGNPLRGDDGVGSALLQEIRASAAPLPETSLIEGHPEDLLAALMERNYQRIIILDAADMSLSPGEWRRFTVRNSSDLFQATVVAAPEAAATLFPSALLASSSHGLGLAEILALSAATSEAETPADTLPEITIYGVQPESIQWSPALSTAVRNSVPQLCQTILDELNTTPSGRSEWHSDQSGC